MTSNKLNKHNLAAQDFLMGASTYSRSTTLLAQSDTSTRNYGGSQLTANDRINQARATSQQRPELTRESLARHDFFTGGLRRAPSTDSNVAQDGTEDEHSQQPTADSMIRRESAREDITYEHPSLNQYDYSNIGWYRTEKNGVWEPRAGRWR